jgi:hypothetical protein
MFPRIVNPGKFGASCTVSVATVEIRAWASTRLAGDPGIHEAVRDGTDRLAQGPDLNGLSEQGQRVQVIVVAARLGDAERHLLVGPELVVGGGGLA